MNDFYDPIVTKRLGTNNEPLQQVSENMKIINGRVVLTQIPNREQKVVVTGSINNVVYTFYEIIDQSINLVFDTTNHLCSYKVDYVRGLVDFPLNVNGYTFLFKYFGSGCHYFPASRVYSSFSSNNDTYDIKQTLQDIVNTSVHHFIFSTVQPISTDGEDGDVWFVYQE